MATQDIVASIQAVGLRVTRLDADGNLLNGAGDSYVTGGMISFTFTPEYDTGDEITQVGASGAVCVTYQSPDTLKRVTLELAICEPDAELTNLLSGGLLLRKNLGTFSVPNRQSIGWAAPAVGDDPSGNGVAVEIWTRAITSTGRLSTTNPYFYWIFPFVKLNLSGDRVIENGLMATAFSGYGLDNITFSAGPDERWEFPAAAGRPYASARTAWAPAGMSGFYTWHGPLTAAVTNGAVASGVATVTTSVAHNFAVGDDVTITGFTVSGLVPLNGSWVITGVPTSTTFTFATTASTVASTAQSPSGSAIVAAGGRPVTALLDTVEDSTDFNVPGNVNYNPTLPNDFIIDAADDPTS